MENQTAKHDSKSVLKTVKTFYSNSAGNLLAKLPNYQTDIRLILSLIIIENLQYLKSSN